MELLERLEDADYSQKSEALFLAKDEIAQLKSEVQKLKMKNRNLAENYDNLLKLYAEQAEFIKRYGEKK